MRRVVFLVAGAVASSAVWAGCGGAEPAPTAAAKRPPEPFVVTRPADLPPPPGREPARILTYAAKAEQGRLDLLINYSSGQRLREVRVTPAAGSSLDVNVMLTPHTVEDLRTGCVSVEWNDWRESVVRQNGKRRVRAARAGTRLARRVARHCRSTPVSRPNTTVDTAPTPDRF